MPSLVEKQNVVNVVNVVDSANVVDSSNVVGGGGAGGGATTFRHIGISPDYDAVEADTGGLSAWPGNQWPSVTPVVKASDSDHYAPLHEIYQNFTDPMPEFTTNHWSPQNFSAAFLAAQDGLVPSPTDTADDGDLIVGPFPTGAALDAELEELVALMEYRPAVMSEALSQAVAIDGYYTGILPFNRFTHPATTRLFSVALDLATSAVMRFKFHYQRPRPNQLCPALMPPIANPQHAAYPSGHSTQAHLIAHIMTETVGARANTQHIKHGTTDPITRNPYFDMAERIARNREVLGLHYRSDSMAGMRLAAELFLRLKANADFNAELNIAQVEWG